MLELYGVYVEQLPDRRALKALLDARMRQPWCDRHRNLQYEHVARSGLAGLLLLQHVGYCGDLCYDEKGRPYLLDQPVDFNISHTAQLSVCAIGTSPKSCRDPEDLRRRVGVDAEDLRRVAAMRICPLAERWFAERELERFLSEPTDVSFLRIWTRKEALVKWIGEGLRAMRSTDTELAEDRFGVRFCEYWQGNTLITLCHHKNEKPPALQMISGDAFWS